MKNSFKLTVAATMLGVVGCYDSDNHKINNYPDSVQLSSESGVEIPADGYSTVTLAATITPADAVHNKLVFSTSAGNLMADGVKTGEDGTVTVTASINGVARVDLRCSNMVETASVTVRAVDALEVADGLDVKFTSADPDDTLRFNPMPPSIPADGASQTPISVEVNRKIPSNDRVVAFDATNGTLSTMTRTADSDGIATVDFTAASTVGLSRITATVKSVSQQASIQMVPALPDQIVVASDGQVKANGTLPVTVNMYRRVGQVSEKTLGIFRAIRPGTDDTVGSFLQQTPASFGEMTAVYAPGGTSYRGDVTIVVGTIDGDVTGSRTVTIVDP